jgi:hypothetical protein
MFETVKPFRKLVARILETGPRQTIEHFRDKV